MKNINIILIAVIAALCLFIWLRESSRPKDQTKEVIRLERAIDSLSNREAGIKEILELGIDTLIINANAANDKKTTIINQYYNREKVTISDTTTRGYKYRHLAR